MELAESAGTDIPSSSEQPEKKQMKLNDEIHLYMADAFTANHEDEKKLKKYTQRTPQERKGRCHQNTRSATYGFRDSIL